MDVKLAQEVRLAAAYARRRAEKYSGIGGDALPLAVIKAFDDTVRGHLERDPRIEDERDRVLITAVSLAEARPEDGTVAIQRWRERLVDAIDGLECVTLALGVVNRRGAAAGLGDVGEKLT